MRKILIFMFLTTFVLAFSCKNKTFSYSNNFDEKKRVSIKTFLDMLATQKCHINIVYSDEIAMEKVKEKMPFLRIKNYTLREILDLILKKRGLFYNLDESKSTLEISYYKTKTYKLDFISTNRIGESNLNATDSRVKNEYNFDFWDKIQANIETILKNTSTTDYKPPVIDRTVGLITVTGNQKQIKAIDRYIATLLDRLTKEVLIDVKIYSVELSKSHSTGINWSQFNISLNQANVPVGTNAFTMARLNLNGLLNFLAKNGNVNSISNPKIVTLNNQKAVISVGDTIYYKYASKVATDANGNPINQYTIDSKFVGVVLDITPQISDNGDIILSIAPTISSFKDPNQLTNPLRDMPPDTKNNTMLSVVKLKNNETLILGGLITNDKSLQVNGVPVLKEIPLIKYLFSSKEATTTKKELVFVITPHIIDFKKKKTLRDLGFGR